MNSYIDEPMLEAFIHDASLTLEMLEQIMIVCEADQRFEDSAIDEIFRHMHSMKGAASMMMFNNITEVSHVLEDVFYLIREHEDVSYDFSGLVDLVLESVDYFKVELSKISAGESDEGDSSKLIKDLKTFREIMEVENNYVKKKNTDDSGQYYIAKDRKNIYYYHARVTFEDGCEMENIRAYTMVQHLMDSVDLVYYNPNDILDNEETMMTIRQDGFELIIKTGFKEELVKDMLETTVFLENLFLESVDKETFELLALQYQREVGLKMPIIDEEPIKKKEPAETTNSKMLSVHVEKLDALMNMVGELVIAESMVTRNPEVNNLNIDSFEKAARQLRKISSDIQDMVMGIRMVPLSTTFIKMHRVVRDMNKNLGKHVAIEMIGETTEVDKSIIEKITDPLMHLIRNAIDHGIESDKERLALEKPKNGKIKLEAKNAGGDVLIIVQDDGRGLNKEAIYKKAFDLGLTDLTIDELSEKEIYSFILSPGFSTCDDVSKYSGRGVGMDVVSQNIEEVGGQVEIDSTIGRGTTVTLRLPLTLAIIEGMNLKVGASRFTLPLMAIKESFRPKKDAVFKKPSGEEMIMLRGACYPILRLHDYYQLNTEIKDYNEGILIMAEENDQVTCLFADELLGQQQVVVKALPEYIKHRNIKGVSGCTLLGDGNISLILDVKSLSNMNIGVIE